VLRDLEGLTYQEIAVALEVSEAHVKTLIFRGRRRYSVIEEAGTSKRFAGALLRFIAGSVGESPVGALSAAYSQL
jgi:hypothetical protein